MRQRWETTYPGVDSDLTERFDNSTQLTLLQNWSRLVDYADALHDKLVKRIEKMSADLLNRKDSVSVTDPHDRRAPGRTATIHVLCC
jgi:hypothetical protein